MAAHLRERRHPDPARRHAVYGMQGVRVSNPLSVTRVAPVEGGLGRRQDDHPAISTNDAVVTKDGLTLWPSW